MIPQWAVIPGIVFVMGGALIWFILKIGKEAADIAEEISMREDEDE